MLGGKRKWKEYAQKAINKNMRNPHGSEGTPIAASDDENPWLSFSEPQSDEIQMRLQKDNQPAAQSVPSRWLEDSESKNQFALRQPVPLSVQKSKSRTGDTKSVFFLQCILAGVLVLSGLYVHQANRPFAKTVDKFTNQILNTDYTNRVVPVMSSVFDRFHVSLPTFGVHAAVYMHVSLQGKIDADFSASHPEIWIQGTQNEPVLAAGSGIVMKVESSGSNSVVEIDHGAIGTSIYSGLGAITVRVHEYVDSGQVIGRMPQEPKNQELHFSLTKDGNFENPHDYIHFSSADGQ